MPNAPVEMKVSAASAGTYLGSTALLATLTALQDDGGRLLEWMPAGLTPFVLALVPTCVSFVAGWKAKHTPRSDSAARPPRLIP
ncbi:hypothetical protein [Streptomyces monomycini]|uniref:hypothetical protein n=1 Tax=Streptomyces monomycini TaxID=371720 RepID=UPI0004ABB1F1|nr:hypothetical protein [Streptomyces monomycini]